MRPTKGIHVVVPRDRLATNSIVLFGSDERMLFAVPHGEHTYLGTTDTDFSGDPSSARADREDVAYVLEAANGLFDAELTEADVVGTWAGVRPLLREEGTPSGVSRDYAIMDGPQGLVTIVGGKLTTFRAMAARLVDHVIQRAGSSFSRRPAACRTRRGPPVGGDTDDFGRIFRNNAVISAEGIMQIAAIMGNCVAGGGYLPVLCDTLRMTEGSGLYLPGPAPATPATRQGDDSEAPGGQAPHPAIPEPTAFAVTS